jgi:hypothetical protein
METGTQPSSIEQLQREEEGILLSLSKMKTMLFNLCLRELVTLLSITSGLYLVPLILTMAGLFSTHSHQKKLKISLTQFQMKMKF